MSKERLKDLIFTAQCAIGEYNDTLDSNLLDKADVCFSGIKALADNSKT